MTDALPHSLIHTPTHMHTLSRRGLFWGSLLEYKKLIYEFNIPGHFGDFVRQVSGALRDVSCRLHGYRVVVWACEVAETIQVQVGLLGGGWN